MANRTGGGRPSGGAFDIDNANMTYATCPCNAGHDCWDNRGSATAVYWIRGNDTGPHDFNNGQLCDYRGDFGERGHQEELGNKVGYREEWRNIQWSTSIGQGWWCPCNTADNNNYNYNVTYDVSKLPHWSNIATVAVGSTITAAKWNEIRAGIINSNNYRGNSDASSGIINNLPVGVIITASNYENLKTHLKDYTRYDLPTVHASDIVTANEINRLIDAINERDLKCMCQCNYCTCNCNNCPCNTHFNATCTCACQHCTCACNHGCTCACAYHM